MVTRTALALAGCWFAVGCRFDPVGTARSALRDRTEHVLLLSIDGFHDFDLTHYVAAHPTSALASLVARGTTYGPEFNGAKKDITKIIANDELKVVAVLNQLDGFDHTGATHAGVPAILGMNFQAVNIAQKFSGYADPAGTTPDTVAVIGAQAGHAPGLAQAMDYVDAAIGRMLAKLDANGLTESTLVIMAAKHGNSPVDRTTFTPIDPDATFPALIDRVAPGLAAQVTADTLALLWLTDHGRAGDVAAVLRASAAAIGGGQVYVGAEIDALAGGQLAGNPGRHPDILVQPAQGVVYATAGSKLCDHAGLHEQDRHVAMVLTGPHVHTGQVHQTVELRQLAPTILKALGLDPHALDAVRREHTHRLPADDDDTGDDRPSLP